MKTRILTESPDAIQQFDKFIDIASAVCKVFQISFRDLATRTSRAEAILFPRWAAMTLTRAHTTYKNAAIARLFDCPVDTMRYGVRCFKAELQTNPTLRRRYEEVRQLLKV